MQMKPRLPDLGPRGEGWVVAQFVLFALIAATSLRDVMSRGSWIAWGPVSALTGGVAILAGGLVAGRGVWDVRASFSPFPRPVAGAPLIESGAYRLVRHPIYSGLVLAAVGWGILTGSILAIMSAALLFLLLAGKSRREEAWLRVVHPEYGAYQARTRRLIPWVY
jgi:protein-S-isoprenylcysteine O-methyltransferase Ste14